MSSPSKIPQRPTHMEIDLAALARNFARLSDFVKPAVIMPVVKANAYGHGLVRCAQHLESVGARWLGVACLEEGVELRQSGVRVPILVFGGIWGEQIEHFISFDLDITASSVSKLEAIDTVARRMKKRARVHLKIDTGMERIGVHSYSARPLLEAALAAAHCDTIGVFSHFACADDPTPAATLNQLSLFNDCIEPLMARSGTPPLRHIANSAGLLTVRESHLDMVRPGLALYGVMPAAHIENRLGLEPVMSLYSKVVYFKVVKKGMGVGYGHTWHAPRDSRVVTVPLGYGDGYFRRLSNRGHALIRGRRYPIVGSVCMDQLMVNIDRDEAYNGDQVVFIGAQGSEKITVEEIAAETGTVPHEVLVSANTRIPRHYLCRTNR